MTEPLYDRLERLEKNDTHRLLGGALHGIEKEGLRVDQAGAISRTPHPGGLGSSLTNRYITTDFSESLLELITPVVTDPAAALHFLQAIHQYTYAVLDEELIWVSSMPCRIDDPSVIPIARFGTSNIGRMKHIYRIGLQHRYGKMMQSIAGIHYNFSLPDEFWESYRALLNNHESLQSFKSSGYFTMIRNFRRHSWLLLYLFGASPALSRSFLGEDTKYLEPLHDDSLFLPWATSLRMSNLGYSNSAQSSINICFNQINTYIKTLTEAINTVHPEFEKIGVVVDGEYRQLSATVLQIENEFYSDIRPKRVPARGESALQALKRGGVEYVEVRNIDVNPLLPLGIDLEQAVFLDMFLIASLLMGDTEVSPAECLIIADNLNTVTTRGRQPELRLSAMTGDVSLRDAGIQLIGQFSPLADLLDRLHSSDIYSRSLQVQLEKLEDPSLTPSARILHALQWSGLEYSEWVLEISRERRRSIEKAPQDPAVLDRLSIEAKNSLTRQAELESSDTMDFDTFLRTYRTQDADSDS